MGAVRPVMIALVMANITNVIMNWVLIYGKFGAPAMGTRGSAWATVISRVAMAAFLLGTIVRRERGRRPGLFETSLAIDFTWMRRLIALGLPAASQLTLEVGVFAASTALAGRLAPIALAAHQIAINIAALSFMVPLGVSSAGAVRVGHALGRRDTASAERAGWTAILIGALFMACTAALFLLIPRVLMGAFSRDEGVLQLGAALLAVAAVFQLFDGIQGVATGVLRGTRRHAHADAVEPRRPLVHRSAEWLRALLRAGPGGRWTVVGPIDWPHHLRRCPAGCMGTGDSEGEERL